MKPILLHRVAAPSPSVLNFLRAQVKAAFESPTLQCAQTNVQQHGYSTYRRTGWKSEGTLRGGSTYSLQRRGRLEDRNFTTSRCLLAQKSPQSASAGSVVVQHASRPSLQYLATPNCRTFSTTRTNNSWNPFSSANIRRLAQLSPPAPPPDENSQGAAGFGSSLGRIMRPANELKMRCTELDEHGNVTLVSGEFKKSELIAKVHSTV